MEMYKQMYKKEYRTPQEPFAHCKISGDATASTYK
jgi:hypothetical protein